MEGSWKSGRNQCLECQCLVGIPPSKGRDYSNRPKLGISEAEHGYHAMACACKGDA